MVTETIVVLTSIITAFTSHEPVETLYASPKAEVAVVVGQYQLDLGTRDKDPIVNQIFTDNILLALHYLKGDVEDPQKIDWEKIHQPFDTYFVLGPGKVFAFHQKTLSEFNQPSVTMNSHFVSHEGYKVVGGLAGNGICHLASLLRWGAEEAGLKVTAKANHDFFPVPGVPKIYGTSILYPDSRQNLYIQNQTDDPIPFFFTFDGQQVSLKILK